MLGVIVGFRAAAITEEQGYARYSLLLVALGILLGACIGCWSALHTSGAIAAGRTTIALAVLILIGVGMVAYGMSVGMFSGTPLTLVAAPLGAVAAAAVAARSLALRLSRRRYRF